MNIYSKSDIGLIRDSNQDSFRTEKINENLVLSTVCDGMGGVNGGNIASKIAVDEITNYVLSNYNEDLSSDEIKKLLYNAVYSSNLCVYNKSRENKELSGMGTTVVVALICNNKLYVVHVGDSRAYILNNNEIKKLTVDHSVVQEMVSNGEITENEARMHPNKNIITRALGVSKDINPDYTSMEFLDEETLLICTDGLTNYIEDEKLFSMFKNNKIDVLPDKLISYAKEMGGSDNITLVIVNK